MNVNDLTIEQLKELAALFANIEHKPCQYAKLIGKNVIVRTVTMIYTGKLLKVGRQELTMTDVSWIPETERYMQFVADGAVRECEPYPQNLPVLVGRGGVIDVCELKVNLPRSQK